MNTVLARVARNARNASSFHETGRSRNLRVFWDLAAPAARGLLLQAGKQGASSTIPTRHDTHWTWTYARDHAALQKLTAAAHRGQWQAGDLPWDTELDPEDPEQPLLLPGQSALEDIPGFDALTAPEQARQKRDFLAWMISQFLHGEQGALFVACQLVQAVGWTDGKLYGATQVMDEGRHLEVFDRYIATKLEKRYAINDNLYVILDALMHDGRWDVKFLGMQILIEGLALGAFGTMRQSTGDPLLRELLAKVITDEARHVHFGVVALQEALLEGCSDAERRMREDWAYEMCVLMRNRFLGHEFYEEHWAHAMTRKEWDRTISAGAYLRRFRDTMFRRVIPNLRRIGLMSERVRPWYAAIGLLDWENGPAAPELRAEDLLAEA